MQQTEFTYSLGNSFIQSWEGWAELLIIDPSGITPKTSTWADIHWRCNWTGSSLVPVLWDCIFNLDKSGSVGSHLATPLKFGAVTPLRTLCVGPEKHNGYTSEGDAGDKAEKNEAEVNWASSRIWDLTALASAKQSGPARQQQASSFSILQRGSQSKVKWDGWSKSKIEPEAPDSAASASTTSSPSFPDVFPTSSQCFAVLDTRFFASSLIRSCLGRRCVTRRARREGAWWIGLWTPMGGLASPSSFGPGWPALPVHLLRPKLLSLSNWERWWWPPFASSRETNEKHDM